MRRVCSHVCTLVSTDTCATYILHMNWCSRHLFSACHTHHNKCTTPAHARLCNCAATSLPWKTLRTVLNLENFVLFDGKQKTWVEAKLKNTPFLNVSTLVKSVDASKILLYSFLFSAVPRGSRFRLSHQFFWRPDTRKHERADLKVP